MRELVVLVLFIGLATIGVGLVTAETTTIDADHGLDSNESVHEWETEGYASGSADRYDLELTVAEDRQDVGLQPSMVGSATNDYLRIQYNEDIERTLRIWIPREYVTPYTRDSVRAVDHTDVSATYRPIEGAEYLQITIKADEEMDVVLPLDKSAQISYGVLERVDKRTEQITGESFRGDAEDWQRIDEDDLADEASIKVSEHPDDTLVQVDARPQSSDPLWTNAPSGNDEIHGISTTVKEDSEGEKHLHVVSTTGSPPDVRVKHNYSRTDYWAGEARSARLIPDRIGDTVFGDSDGEDDDDDDGLLEWLPGRVVIP